MEFDVFKRIVTCFADRVDDMDAGKGDLLVQIRDETIIATLQQRPNGLIVEENGVSMRAESWIVNRVARVSLLADRICSYVSPPDHFISPAGSLLDHPDHDPSRSGDGVARPDAVEAVAKLLDRRPGGATSVVYLTSDAGEGKTSLIDYLAVAQAKEYKAKRTDWLLVPISLRGRTFLRFDDVVVSSLVNRLRFQLLYYDAFLELVRLGVLVPAFDGFEEMIVESSSGEAISALGNLVGKLQSAGTVLVAARKAYFDYLSFRTQAKLFDVIGTQGNVTFGRVSLKRWDRSVFTRYARERDVGDPDDLFQTVARRLGDEHPVLTRAVLVRRLVDVAVEKADLSLLLQQMGQDPQDYFHQFVVGLVDREAKDKWVDKSGDPPRPLLTTEEHHELLAMVAQEMWLSTTDDLKIDEINILVEMFADAKKKNPAVTRQIGERIKQHSLLVVSGIGREALAFDHEDFSVFYLGQALGRTLVDDDSGTVRTIVEKAALPTSAAAEAIGFVQRQGGDRKKLLALLQRLADVELPASFVKENCGVLTLALLNGQDSGPYEIRNMSFPTGALSERDLRNVTVSGSYFHATSLTDTVLRECRFVNCDFERIEFDDSAEVLLSSFDGKYNIGSVIRTIDADDPIERFDPVSIKRELRRAGFEIKCDGVSDDETSDRDLDSGSPDEDLLVLQRFLRGFRRANEINEVTIRLRLGRQQSKHFFNSLLPRLQESGVVREVGYRGRGVQKRFKLAAQMTRIEKALSEAGGTFDRFVQAFPKHDGANQR